MVYNCIDLFCSENLLEEYNITENERAVSRNSLNCLLVFSLGKHRHILL